MNVRNRVIEVRSVRFADVKTHPRNPRRHSRKQGKVLQALVSEVGFASIPLAYHSETNHGALTWVDGHLRSQTFPDYQGQVAILDITDEEASVLLSTLDPLASMATTDAAAIESLINEAAEAESSVTALLHSVATEAGLYARPSTRVYLPKTDDLGLVYSPAINRKMSIHFLSIRRWNAAHKQESLRYLKEIKRGEISGEETIQRAAAEIAELVGELLGNHAFSRVTTPPIGHEGWHFATSLATEVASRLNIPFAKLFADRIRSVSSHPKMFNKRAPATLLHQPEPGMILLVDDVATSVVTLEECTSLLRPFAPTLPVAWIYSVANTTAETGE